MAAVPVTLAEWLRSAELVEVSTAGAIIAAWADLAADVAVSSPLTLRADASVEAARQLDFFATALAVETVAMPGRQASLVGKAPRIAIDVPGYEAAPSVFVVEAEEREDGTTLLTVLRRVEAA